jgi:hypothetical protein
VRAAVCPVASALRHGETDARCQLAHTLQPQPYPAEPMTGLHSIHGDTVFLFQLSKTGLKNSQIFRQKKRSKHLKKQLVCGSVYHCHRVLRGGLHCQAGSRRRHSTHGAALCPAKSSSSTAIPFVHQRHVCQVPARRYLLRCNRVSVSRSSTYCRRGHHLRLQQHLQLVYLAVRHNHQPADAFDFGRYPRVQFQSPPPLLCSNASRRRLYSVYASLVPHDASSSDARYVFYAQSLVHKRV